MKISVIIPVLNESARVQSVIRLAKSSPLVGEVIVVDDEALLRWALVQRLVSWQVWQVVP